MPAVTDRARLAEAFGQSSDPEAYVPRLALAELAEEIGKKPACAALSGDAGLGKTLLLHVLRERLEGSFECLYVPFPRLEPPELWRWLAVALGLGRGDDDRGAVLGRARRLAAEGMGLVLLVDDAGQLPAAARTQLLAACSTRGLSLVLAFDTADAAQLASLPPQVRRVELGPPMTLAELRAYVHARLRRAGADDALTARLGPAELAALHEASGGVPAQLHARLEAWLGDPSAGLAPAPRSAAAGVARAEAPVRGARPAGRLDLSPRLRLALAALFVLLIAGFWSFALQRGPGVASVGVPVEPLAPPAAPPMPEPGPTLPPAAVPAAPEAPVTPAPLPGRGASDAVAAEVAG
jgi:type II secretory pathway predicted ATPase ExeA